MVEKVLSIVADAYTIQNQELFLRFSEKWTARGEKVRRRFLVEPDASITGLAKVKSRSSLHNKVALQPWSYTDSD